MKSASSSYAHKTGTMTVPLLAIILMSAWLGLYGGSATANPSKANPSKKEAEADAHAVPRAWESNTQGRTQAFSSFKDWNLKAENLVPRGHNPLYFPLEPGFKYILEYKDHPWGNLYIEVEVLEKTEKFDVPGLGKFECAVVREEEFYDGVYDQSAENWFCYDKSTGAMYAFGETSWEIDQIGRKVFVGTWRVGEPDGNGMAEPGMLMPGQFMLGAKYIFDGHEAEAYGYSENLESGLTITVPAGTFEDCVRVREFSLTNPSDVTDKWWCPGVGMVRDSSDGVLIASSAVPGTDLAQFGKYHRNPVKVIDPPVAKVDGIEATEIALKEVPGKANSVKIERLGRRNVYAVEIIADKDGGEWDVFVDIETGEVVGTDN